MGLGLVILDTPLARTTKMLIANIRTKDHKLNLILIPTFLQSSNPTKIPFEECHVTSYNQYLNQKSLPVDE